MYNRILKAAAKPLETPEVTEILEKQLAGWCLRSHNDVPAIETSIKLKDFETTSSFINQVNLRSHLLGHHPTIQYTYNNVKIILQTHDANAVTDVDITMAKKINSYIKRYQ
ncbi:4A-hydroxytetrahydrobiopterin dehydratase [Saccharomycopsis crataegensis]|uniref:4a-hydroxytetrahydrobiopterin dehydratase n=1 Tax=Saccharomycopsis crataegensis TaxID=43959 RepID=A0AAV5QIF3_9ASCO|nr:4A-hydroxytetrahydrobiopterin dehydratase [Saccharomycopsis crataegensis]